jgi:predicted kinase
MKADLCHPRQDERPAPVRGGRRHGTFEVNITTLLRRVKAVSSASGEFSMVLHSTAPVQISAGTGAYKVIHGSVTVTLANAMIFAKKNGKCPADPETAIPVGEVVSAIGSGHVSFRRQLGSGPSTPARTRVCDRVGVLVVMAGLPAAGKSAVAESLASALGCTVLSVDPVEAAMWRAGVSRDQPTGLAAYVVVEALAAEQLALGHDVIIDAVNGVEPAREQWRQLARRAGSALRYIEVRCSDEAEHRRRLESRSRPIEGFYEPSWNSVQERRSGFASWHDERLVLDSMAPLADNLRLALDHLAS